MQIDSYFLEDDGCVPNNDGLPLLVYANAFGDDCTVDDAIDCFERNGWCGAWVNGIYDFHHYHARSHEVLANLGAEATVQFGGEKGPVIRLQRGSAVIIPAGGGHCRRSGSTGLVVVGAYPIGQESWDLKRADKPSDYASAKLEIPQVAMPTIDPVAGRDGPLLKLWKS